MARQSIDELAKNVQLPNKRTSEVVEFLKHDILIALYRKNPNEPLETAEAVAESMDDGPEKDKLLKRAQEKVDFNIEMNKKVADTFQRRYGKEFDPKIQAKNKHLSLFLMGPPGQGKTASYIVAAKETCADLGLRFVEHVTDNYVPRKTDFIMVVQECAGENSAITFGGVPKAEEVEVGGVKTSVLKKALNYRFTLFEHCAGGVLLFDDAANAAQVIQNILLPVAQFGSFQGMKIQNAMIGFTGNLGSLDGTYTTEISSALRTRVVPLFVTDTVDDFAKRAYEYYNDALGDLGIINFLKRNARDFASLPDPGEKSGFPCSRSWDNLIQSIRSSVERHGGRGKGEDNALAEIHQLAYSLLGSEVGQKLVGYFNSMIKGADPLAREFIMDNKPNLEKLKSKYSSGASGEEISFGYQFATACGDYAVNLVAQNKNPEGALEDAMKRFGTAVLNLNDSEFGFSLEHLKNKLAAYITDFSQQAKDGRELKGDIRTRIAKTINDLQDCDESKRDILIKVITDFDKMQNTHQYGKKIGRKAMS